MTHNTYYRILVFKTNKNELNVHNYDDYDTMDYNATLLQFSRNNNLIKAVAQEETLTGWKTLFTIDFKSKNS